MPENKGIDGEKLRKAAAAMLDALGPEEEKKDEVASGQAPAQTGAHSHSLEFKEDGAFCTDCNERYVKAPASASDLIDQLNRDFHTKHDFLNCTECKDAFGKKIEGIGEGKKYKFSDDGKVIKITRQK